MNIVPRVQIPGRPKSKQRVCGAPHPDIRIGRNGKAIPLTCMGKKDHRGKHRARILDRLVYRWGQA